VPTIYDVAGNAFAGTVNGTPETYTLDPTPPEIDSIARSSPTEERIVLGTASVTLDVTFSENVTGVALSDFGVGGTSNGTTVDSMSGSDASYTVTLDTSSADAGTVTLSVSSSGSIVDAAGNAFGGTVTSSEGYIIDAMGPEVASITRSSPANESTNATTLVFLVTFDEDATGVDVDSAGGFDDFSLAGTSAGAVISEVLATTNTVLVTVDSSAATEGTVELGVTTAGSIVDWIGNAFIGTVNGTPETYTLDFTPPEIDSITRSSPASQLTNATSVTLNVTFNEDVTGVDVSDFETTGTSNNVVVDSVSGSGSGAVWSVTVDCSSATDGTLSVGQASVPTVQDVAGNAFAGTVNGTPETYTLDYTPPTVSSIIRLSPAGDVTNATSVVFQVTFSESVTGVDSDDFVLAGTATGGVIGAVGGLNETWTVTVDLLSPSDGTLDLNLAAAGSVTIQDLAGNALVDPTAGATETYLLDYTSPSVILVLADDIGPASMTTIEFTVTFDEDVSGVDESDFILTFSDTAGGSVTAVVQSAGDTCVVTVGSASGAGTIRLDVLADGSIVDSAGNSLGAAYASGDVVERVIAPAAVTTDGCGAAQGSGAAGVVLLLAIGLLALAARRGRAQAGRSA
jgi:hypothetical protein